MTNQTNVQLSDVAETLLIRLYFRAKETQRPDALVKDEQAAALVKQLDYDFSRIKLRKHDEVAIILRLREFDRFARDFLNNCPDAVVVHIGCGLDTRFQRVAEGGRVEWYDLDLPEVVELRRKLIGGEGERYHLLACSMFDRAWLDTVSIHRPRPFLFIAEAVLMYFEEVQVKRLVLTLRERFPGAELVCDAVTPFMVRLDNLHLVLTPVRARVHWGLAHGRDLETWGEGIRLLEEWFYFERPEPRLGSMQMMRHIPAIRKASGIFHYRLGEVEAQDA
jgi:O-methyltransferase involved in polyketide biosynthesis